MRDRRLILVVQGDDQDTDCSMWLEEPTASGAHIVTTKNVLGLDAVRNGEPWVWAQNALGLVLPHVSEDGSVKPEYDIASAVLEATRAFS